MRKNYNKYSKVYKIIRYWSKNKNNKCKKIIIQF